jgi:hypothetical protein
VPDAPLIGSAYPSRPISLVSAGIDWLTATADPHDGGAALLTTARLIGLAQQRAGYRVKVAKAGGYSGWRVEGVFAGWRADSVMVVVSGEVAHREAWRVATAARHVTRLDTECTVSGWPAGHDLANLGWRQATRYRPKTGRPPKVANLRSVDSGATLYLGARTSTVYARLYDKSAESGGEHLAGQWRYEVEYKAEACAPALAVLDAAPDRMAGVIGSVHAFFLSRGVRPVFTTPTSTLVRTPAPAPSDAERTIRWIAKHVRPSLERLIVEGHAASLEAAFGPLVTASLKGTSGT